MIRYQNDKELSNIIMKTALPLGAKYPDSIG